MKKLTEITCEDAIAILSKIYPLLFVNKFNENIEKDWKLINCDDIEPGCKKLFNENKIYCFYFYYDSIEIDYVNEESTNNIMTYFDVKYKCYVEAYKLGYYIPELSEILNKNN